IVLIEYVVPTYLYRCLAAEIVGGRQVEQAVSPQRAAVGRKGDGIDGSVFTVAGELVFGSHAQCVEPMFGRHAILLTRATQQALAGVVVAGPHKISTGAQRSGVPFILGGERGAPDGGAVHVFHAESGVIPG